MTELQDRIYRATGEVLVTILARGQQLNICFRGGYYRWVIVKDNNQERGDCDVVGSLGTELQKSSDQLERDWVAHWSGLSVANSDLCREGT